MHVVEWPDIGYAARFSTECCGTDADPHMCEFWIRKLDSHPDNNDECNGLVKWDGCSDIIVPHYTHACDAGGIMRLTEAIRRAYNAAGSMLLGFEGDECPEARE